jgi:DNA-binding response OmpR family regulator
MDILIAEDDPISRRTLEITLQRWGHRVVVTHDGQAAYDALSREDAPRLAIIDWMIPHLDGLTWVSTDGLDLHDGETLSRLG